MAGITLYVFRSKRTHDISLIIQYSGPFIFGYVVQNLSWQMGFWFISIPLGLNVLMVFFLVPEVSVPCSSVGEY